MNERNFGNRPRHFTNGSFFGVDRNNECGLQLVFSEIKSGRWIAITGETKIEKRFEGPPGHAHGGITATILDEAMGACCFRNGFAGLSVSMQMFWHEPVPIGELIRIEANLDFIDDARVHTAGRLLLPNGKRAASATAAYLDRPKVFEEFIKAKNEG